jgi:hypothetical protein
MYIDEKGIVVYFMEYNINFLLLTSNSNNFLIFVGTD